jgi:hypothetical protein
MSPPEQPPDLASCLQPTRASGGGALAKRGGGASDKYPACPYTQAQLRELMALAGPCFSALGYSLPPACAPVLEGSAQGGVDAVPTS